MSEDEAVEVVKKHIARSEGRSLGAVASDTGKAVMGGLGNLVEGIGTVGGLVGEAVGIEGAMDNPVRRAGQRAGEYWEDEKSDYMKVKKEDRSHAIKQQEGFWGQAGTAIAETTKDPALLADFVAENITMLIPSSLIAQEAGVPSAIPPVEPPPPPGSPPPSIMDDAGTINQAALLE